MSYEKTLLDSEKNALQNREFISSVTKNSPMAKSAAKRPIFSILGAIILAIAGIFIMQSDEEIPSLFNDLIIEATDVQNADHIESSKIVFTEALKSGNIPNDTAALLKEKGYTVGYLDENGNFVEENKASSSLVLKKDNNIITADNFINEIDSNIELYAAFKHATYDKAAYYFDDAANDVFKEIEANRNEFNNPDNTFSSVANSKLNTKNINLNTANRNEYKEVDEEGNEYTVIKYEENGGDINTKNSTAESIIENVREKNKATSSTNATLMAADELKVADTISKEKRSMSFYATFMENISKMKAGEGSTSKINDAMNFLYQKTENQIVDTTTGELITVSGSPLESPSLTAILMNKTVDINKTTNYSSDRILNLAKNNLNLTQASNNTTLSSDNIINSTVASISSRLSSIGRLIKGGTELATSAVLAPLTPTISSSLIQSSLDNMNGIVAGEFLVEGAVNLGRTLAVRGSGATAGDTSAVLAYQKLNNKILAMDAAVDRMERSPFDTSSKNTFLGSILYQFALAFKPSSIFTSISSISTITGNSLLSLFPTAKAVEETTSFLSTFGKCETYATIGAVGSAHCSSIATFDTSTLTNLYSNQEYSNFIEENTYLSNGTRVVKPGSYLAKFIDYNNERSTPLGTTDGGILQSLRSGSSYIPFISEIKSLAELFFDASEEELNIATGRAFVNSASNPEWQNYKYAQRYVSIARATTALRQFSNDPTAYNNIQYLEGTENPVIAYMHKNNTTTIASTGVINEN